MQQLSHSCARRLHYVCARAVEPVCELHAHAVYFYDVGCVQRACRFVVLEGFWLFPGKECTPPIPSFSSGQCMKLAGTSHCLDAAVATARAMHYPYTRARTPRALHGLLGVACL